jgi:hypothetical protein
MAKVLRPILRMRRSLAAVRTGVQIPKTNPSGKGQQRFAGLGQISFVAAFYL